MKKTKDLPQIFLTCTGKKNIFSPVGDAAEQPSKFVLTKQSGLVVLICNFGVLKSDVKMPTQHKPEEDVFQT